MAINYSTNNRSFSSSKYCSWTCKIIDAQTIQHLEDLDEVEISQIFYQTKNALVQDFYDKSVEKRKSQKAIVLPPSLESNDAADVLSLEKTFCQKLSNLADKEKIAILQILAKDLVMFGCKFAFNEQSTSSSSTPPPIQLNP